MKQLILIIPSALIKNFNYRAAKQSIVVYVGKRLVEETEDSVPGIFIKEVLDKEDKQAIKDMIFPQNESGTIAFIEVDDDCESKNDDYLSARIL